MTILAIEFSSVQRSVALLDEDRVVAESVHEEPGHTPVTGLVRGVLDQAGWNRNSIGRIVVGLGPGSYAGIRLSLAFAQGWSLKGGVGVVGVSSLDALIMGIPRTIASDGAGALALVDAQRGEFHAQRIRLLEGAWKSDGELLLMAKAEVDVALSAGQLVVGPGIQRWFGEGLNCCPSARELGLLGRSRGSSDAPELIEPLYLRSTSFVKAPLVNQNAPNGLG